MLKKTIIKSLTFSLFLGSPISVYAGKIDGEIEGFYIPTNGWAESQELYPDSTTWEQLGLYNLVLNREGWDLLSSAEKKRIRKKLVIKGSFHGFIKNPTTAPEIQHQLASQNRDGALYTLNDEVSLVGVEPCSDVGAIFKVQEKMKFQNGSGIYKNLQPESSVTLSGSIDTCTLQNEFDVIEGQGGLCFGKTTCNSEK